MFGNPTKVAPFLDAAPSPLRSRPLTDDDPLSPSSLEGNLVPPTPDPKVKSEEDEKVDDEDFDKVQMNPKFSPFFPEQKPSSLQLDTGPSPRLGDDEVGERGMRGAPGLLTSLTQFSHDSTVSDSFRDDSSFVQNDTINTQDEAVYADNSNVDDPNGTKDGTNPLHLGGAPISIPHGDYSFMICIHELRDLKVSRNVPPDPVVFVDIFNQRFHTRVMEGCCSCKFDQSFMAKVPGLNQDLLETAEIKITVIDSNAKDANDETLGHYSIDVSGVYCSNVNHVMSRSWVGLVNEDHEQPDVTGYMKLSTAIAGPNENLKSREATGSDEVISREVIKEYVDIFQTPEIPRGVRRTTLYLVTSIYHCENLPFSNDSPSFLSSANAMDVEVIVEVGTKKMHSQVVRIEENKDEDSGKATFNVEIWLPVELPTISDLVKYTIRDKICDGMEEPRLIANYSASLRDIRNGVGKRPYYANLYGAQTAISETFANNLSSNNLMWDRSAMELKYNMFPDQYHAPNYRGRILLKQRVEEKLPGDMANVSKKHGLMRHAVNQSSVNLSQSNTNLASPVSRMISSSSKTKVGPMTVVVAGGNKKGKPFRRHTKKGLAASNYPQMRTYKVYLAVVHGTEIPEFSGTHVGRALVMGQMKSGEATKMCIKVQCGAFVTYSKPAHNHNGICEFFELLEIPDEIIFPKDLNQVPDVIISVCKSQDEPLPVSYKRFNFKETFEGGEGDLNFGWEVLRKDKASDLLGMEMFPGSLLMKLGVFDAAYPDNPHLHDKWKKAVTSKHEKKQFQLRCHIYQGSNLPSVAPGILLDPFVKINFNGEESKFTNKVNNKNNYPRWYETIVFDTHLPENPDFFPQVNVQVWDHEILGPNDYLSCIMAPLGEENIVQSQDAPTPQWFELFVEDEIEKGNYGKLLCSFQVIDMTKDAPPIPESIKPKFRNVFIEIILVGCTNLEPFESRQIEFANLEFCIGSGSDDNTATTKGSKKPSRSNPNFLERKIVECSLPVEDIFLEGFPLVANLYDNRSYGFGNRKPLVGKCHITLKSVEVEGIKRAHTREMVFSPFKAHQATQALELLEMHSPRLDIFEDDRKKRDIRVTSAVGVNSLVGTENRFQLGRATMNCTLEDYIIAPPFKDYNFSREGDSLQSVGTMKARVVFLKSVDDPPSLDTPYFDTKSLLKKQPRRFVVRAYVLQGWDFVSSGTDEITGRKKVPKPYLKVSLGDENVHYSKLDDYFIIRADRGKVKNLKKKLDEAKAEYASAEQDKKRSAKARLDRLQKKLNQMQDSNTFGFYTHFELPTTLPATSKGDGVLEVTVLDHHSLEVDSVIGSTKIDLLDRYYSTAWQMVGLENKVQVTIKDLMGQAGTVPYGELDRIVHKFSRTATGWRFEDDDDDDAPNDLDAIAALIGIDGEQRCPHCHSRYNPLCKAAKGYQCYCVEIEFLQQVHQRYATKPVENRPLTVPTSKLPRGGLKVWVDILLKDEAKKYITSYYLPENYIKGLFEKCASRRKEFLSFGNDDIVEIIDKLSEINKASVFFGKSKGNSVVRQCIAYKNYELLEFYLRQKPLAAFVRHQRDRDGEEAANKRAANGDGDDSDIDALSDDDGLSDDEESDSDGSEDEEEEEEGEVVEMEEDHAVDREDGDGVADERFETPRKQSSVRGVYTGTKTVDAFEFALRKKEPDYEAVRIMAEIVSKPLVEQFGYLPNKITKMLKKLMRDDYHELVESVLASIPLAVSRENDSEDPNVTLTTPLGDLGTLGFLTSLVEKSNTSVFDTDIVAVVVEKLWEEHIQKKFYFDFCLLMAFCSLWAIQCNLYAKKADDWKKGNSESVIIMLLLIVFNTYFALKELRQAKKTADLKVSRENEEDEGMGWGALIEGWGVGEIAVAPGGPVAGGAVDVAGGAGGGGGVAGEKPLKKKKASYKQIATTYLSDSYNWFDLANVFLVYFSTFTMKMHVDKDTEVACATIGSFTLTFKALGFLRGFSRTGWLVKVLNQNFKDMVPFIIIMTMLIVGFTVIFRLTLNDLPGGDCGVDDVEDALPAEWSCDPNPYGSFFRSLANVFSMSILGDFDTALFDNASNGDHMFLSWAMFVFMQVYMAVICLNALIALLGDSYGDVQQNQFANMRKERATLIVEHLIVMMDKERRQIQEDSRTVTKLMSKKDWATKKKSLGARLFQSDWDTTEYMVEDLTTKVENLQKQLDHLVAKLCKERKD